METLFRLTLMRPPTELPPEAPPVAVAQDTPLQQQLAEARTGADPRGTMKALARAFAASDQFVPDLRALPLGKGCLPWPARSTGSSAKEGRIMQRSSLR